MGSSAFMHNLNTNCYSVVKKYVNTLDRFLALTNAEDLWFNQRLWLSQFLLIFPKRFLFVGSVPCNCPDMIMGAVLSLAGIVQTPFPREFQAQVRGVGQFLFCFLSLFQARTRTIPLPTAPPSIYHACSLLFQAFAIDSGASDRFSKKMWHAHFVPFLLIIFCLSWVILLWLGLAKKNAPAGPTICA